MEAQPHPAVGRVDGDNLVLTQSWLNQLPLIAVFLVAEILVISLVLLFPDVGAMSLDIGDISLEASYISLLPSFILLKAAFTVYNERLVLTPEYMIHVTGRLSWREKSTRLVYQHIQEIETAQSILQKVCGIGDILITPVGGSSSTMIQMKGLRSPRSVKDIIRSHMGSSITRQHVSNTDGF